MSTEPELPSIAVPRIVILLLSMIAGYVDGCTFLALFGLFVAQVTGSYVIAGAQLFTSIHEPLIKTLGIPAFFFAGVVTAIVATLLSRGGKNPLPWTLLAEMLLLIAFMVTALLGVPLSDANAPAALATGLFGLMAMGVQNAMVRLLFADPASTNVMTTNTAQFAIDFGELLVGWLGWRQPSEQRRTSRKRLLHLLLIIVGFAAGTLAGAGAYVVFGFWCMLAPIGVNAGLCAWSLRSRPLHQL